MLGLILKGSVDGRSSLGQGDRGMVVLAEPIVVKDFFSFINSSDIVCMLDVSIYAVAQHLSYLMEGGRTFVLFYRGLFFSS